MLSTNRGVGRVLFLFVLAFAFGFFLGSPPVLQAATTAERIGQIDGSRDGPGVVKSFVFDILIPLEDGHMFRSFKPERSHFIPKGAIKITPKGIADCEIYLYERAGRAYALGFAGRRQKPDFHNSYAGNSIERQRERREQAVRDYIDRQRQHIEYRAGEAEKRRGFKHGYKVGDIAYTSWGYDQTNLNFYQVTETTPGTVTVREIAQIIVEQTGWASSNRKGEKDAFLENAQPIRCRVSYAGANNKGGFRVNDQYAHEWDGRAKHSSSYA